MKQITFYIKSYWKETDRKVLAIVIAFTALLIFCNYYFNIDGLIRKNSFPVKLFYWYMVFLAAFAFPYILYFTISGKQYYHNRSFLFLLLIAPLIFALKLTIDFSISFAGNAVMNRYWQHILYWPFLLLLISVILYVIWFRLDKKEQPFYGFRIKQVNWKPYWLMLLIMLPLVAAASTQADFLAVYPKLNTVTGLHNETQLSLWHKLLFEIAYGSDFLGIELFFRGFLILAFVKWAGKDAILPMACFYCTIHFGKPAGECISSFFGGMLLGIVVYNTRSVFGGLLVHLGIAWLMELGGFAGHIFFS